MTNPAADLLRKQAQDLIDKANALDNVNHLGYSARRSYVAFVLDASGSMDSCKQGTIEGYNVNLQTLKNSPASAGEIFVSLYTIGGPNTKVVANFINRPVSLVQPLTTYTYTPDGGTPLYDGIGLAITDLSYYEALRPAMDIAFLVNIFTDGDENSSKAWRDASRLSSLIREKQSSGHWTFTVAGANISLADLAQKTGILAANMMPFRSDNPGTQQMFQQHTNSTAGYMANRSMGATQSQNFYSPTSSTFAQEELQKRMAEAQRQAQQQSWNQQLGQVKPASPKLKTEEEKTPTP